MLDEVPGFQGEAGERVFTVLHRPAGAPRGGFLFCHPFGEEKLWSHRVFVAFARRLAGAGWNVLRMDFRGEGDSDRSFEETDLATRLEDARTGLRALRAELPREAPVGLLGLRLGGSVAAIVAAESGSRVDRLVLWDPVVKGSPYMQSVLLTNLAGQLAVHRKVVEDRKALVERMRRGSAVNIEGYGLSLGFFEQVSAIDLTQTLPAFRGRGLVVQIGTKTPSRRDLAELGDRCPGLEFREAEEEPFWKEIRVFYQRADRLTGVTERWLEERG